MLLRLKVGSSGKTVWSASANVEQEVRTQGSWRAATSPLPSWAQFHFGSSESTQPINRSVRPLTAGSWLRGSVFPLKRIYFASAKQYNQPSNPGVQGWVPLALLLAEPWETQQQPPEALGY